MININKIKIAVIAACAFVNAGDRLLAPMLDDNKVYIDNGLCDNGTVIYGPCTTQGYYVCEVPAPKVDPEQYEVDFRRCLTRAVSKGQTLGPVEEGKIYVNWFEEFPALCSFYTKRDGRIIYCDKFGQEVPIFSRSGADQMLAEMLAAQPQEDFHINIVGLITAVHAVRGAR